MSKRRCSVLIRSLAAVIIAALMFLPTVYADTDGTELKTTAQPDRLELQLGTDWAGMEFELTLDSGVFPVPVVVNDTGVLTMDLGGSKTYTLKLLSSPVSVEDPAQLESKPESPAASSEQPSPTPSGTPESTTQREGIPPLHLILFIGGLLLAVGVLIFMHIAKKRREYSDDDDDYEYDEDDE